MIRCRHPVIRNRHKNGCQALKSHKSFTFQKSTFHAISCLGDELCPTDGTYSLFYWKSSVTWAHPDVFWAITQYLNLGNILRRSPLDSLPTFAFFWEQSAAFNRGCPRDVFGFQITTKTPWRSLGIHTVTWFKECFHDGGSWERQKTQMARAGLTVSEWKNTELWQLIL